MQRCSLNTTAGVDGREARGEHYTVYVLDRGGEAVMEVG